MSVYDYRNYKAFLTARSVKLGLRSGLKSQMARAAGCNSAYISNVLGGKAHLSLEQAERICAMLEFGRDESHYFLLLLQRARAGTVALASYFDDQLEIVLAQKLNVQKRLGAKERLSKEDQAQYYSSWMYAAIHVALSVPKLAQSAEAIATYFELPLPPVKKVLDFLLMCGLATRKGSAFAIGPRHIHLGKDSENIQRHHGNFRLQALKALERDSEHSLNYSAAVTLSREDAYKVREILLTSIKSSADLITKSPEEEVFALNVDFIPLGRLKTVRSGTRLRA
jgi:uncharacterized protein (TIGR02147 family)